MDNFNWRIILSFSIADATDNQVIIMNLIVIAKEYSVFDQMLFYENEFL